ncbi:hypothetical protein D3872_06720 [Massilia cavernae]|uniref:ArsR family transcriptional regulator n=1 Tax=Massilia cavernae TaxID=2320864 RepID=A0A418Y5C3_9BURK|nr:hypothetical protein D3872_06720 [Massilia cavernae]
MRRISNLRALVEEFGKRDLGCAAAALFLSCSFSSARNYIVELLDAGVLAAHPVRQGAGCLDRTLYQLTADRLARQRFLATLAESDDAGFSFGPGDRPARRDPLVAALFGAPGSDAEHREPAARA